MNGTNATNVGPIEVWPARALAALLDLPVENIRAGSCLPPLWHWVYLHDHVAQAGLGPEGHALDGVPAPPAPGLLRMFAGGRVTTHRPIEVGMNAESHVEEVRRRRLVGRSGELTIITTRREVRQRRQTVVTEEQDIIYREPTPLPLSDRVVSEGSEGPQREVAISETMLFRFSALTYNAHRIHYDVDYCRDHEGYAALVVHGPLQALLMSEFARDGHPSAGPSSFVYRLVSPLLLGQGLVVGKRGADNGLATTVHDASGRLTAVGSWANETPSRG